MKYVRLYNGADEKSHFQDIEIPLQADKSNRSQSEPIKATSIFFRETHSNYYLDWHNASRRQFVITLEGEVEIVAGDGTKRRFGPGDIMLAEDTTGQGHTSRALNNQPRKAIWVTLE